LPGIGPTPRAAPAGRSRPSCGQRCALPRAPSAAPGRRLLAGADRRSLAPSDHARAWALDGLARFALTSPRLRAEALEHVARFERSGQKALATRARHVRALVAASAARTPHTGGTGAVGISLQRCPELGSFEPASDTKLVPRWGFSAA
jgi:hypothetical protein